MLRASVGCERASVPWAESFAEQPHFGEETTSTATAELRSTTLCRLMRFEGTQVSALEKFHVDRTYPRKFQYGAYYIARWSSDPGRGSAPRRLLRTHRRHGRCWPAENFLANRS